MRKIVQEFEIMTDDGIVQDARECDDGSIWAAYGSAERPFFYKQIFPPIPQDEKEGE